MRRLVTLISAGAVLLSSCRRAGDLPPEEVLRRATIRSGQLQSVEYDASFRIGVRRESVTLSVDGTVRGELSQGGQQASFSLVADGTLDRGSARTGFRFSADVVRDVSDTYVFLRDVSIVPESPIFQGITTMTGTWWMLPRRVGGGSFPSLTPDPRFLRAQSDVVIVLQDHGLKDLDGIDAYHYDVAIDHERLVNLMKVLAEEQGQPFDAGKTRTELQAYDARGQLWIDAKTFAVYRLEWRVTSKEQPPATRLTLDMHLRSHDAAPPVTVPSGALPLGPDAFLQQLLILPSSSGSLRFPL